jgi:hypothetical protein
VTRPFPRGWPTNVVAAVVKYSTLVKINDAKLGIKKKTRNSIVSTVCCNDRHSSVGWNLTVGKNLLWVAQQHGYRVTPRLNVYAAWDRVPRPPEADHAGKDGVAGVHTGCCRRKW